jgi:serine/threonine protein kinase/formylglycine-generating enzyme required for sulfatase activity
MRNVAAGGDVIDARWRLVAQRGEGTFGTLWVADDEKFAGRQVAVKFLKPEFVDVPEIARRFDNEAHALGILRHENIVAVLDRGKWQGVLYIVMEYVEGTTLADHIADAQESGALTLPTAAAIFDQICSGVAVAHRLPDVGPIVHRDLKPENVMLASDVHGRMRVKILDFGIAQLGNRRGTQSGVRVGTPIYMAPEQTLGEVTRIGPQADVFALAVLLLEMLTGLRERDPDTTWSAFILRGGAVYEEIRHLRTDVPDAIWRVIAGALHSQPESRPPDAGALREMVVSAWPPEIGRSLMNAAAFLSAPPSVANSRHNDGPFVRVESGGRSQGTTVLQRDGRRWSAVVGLSVLAAVFGGELARRLMKPPTVAPVVIVTLNPCPPGMVLIQGARAASDAGEQATVPAFCIDQHEVTVEMFARAAQREGRAIPTTLTPTGDVPTEVYERFGTNCRGRDPIANASHPMNCVDWADAQRHCASRGARLPTEVEWEGALRAATGRRFPWGNETPTGAWLNACGPECLEMLANCGPGCILVGGGSETLPAPFSTERDLYPMTAPVKSFVRDRTPEGVWDLAGNVKEWLLDPFAGTDAGTDGRGLSHGGSCAFTDVAFDPAMHAPLRRTVRRVDLGFRCAAPVRPDAGS